MSDMKKIARTFIKMLGLMNKSVQLSDPRKQPTVPFQDIISLIMMLPIYQCKSMLELDEVARRWATRKLIGTDRPMVCSDTSIQRIMPQTDCRQMGELLRRSMDAACAAGRLVVSLPQGVKRSVGILDGSYIFRQWFVAFVRLGSSECHTQAIEMMKKRGYERSTAATVLKGQKADDLPDVILGDGLYLSQSLFTLVRRTLQRHILVKYPVATDKKPRTHERMIIDNAIRRMDHPDVFTIRTERGFDDQRLRHYQIEAVYNEYGDISVQIMRVTEHDCRNPKTAEQATQFWIITTDTQLPLAAARELAHLRWSIENGTFKMWSAQAGTKRMTTHHRFTAYNLLCLIAAGVNLLSLIRATCCQEIREYSGVKQTWRSVCRWLCDCLEAGALQEQLVFR